MQTERLYVRQYREDDIHARYAIFSDSETMRYYPAPFSLEQTRSWIKKIKKDTK